MTLRRKIEFKKLGLYENEDLLVLPLEEFLEEVGCTFIAGDGLISEILVDGEKTNIIVPDWIWWWWEGHPSMPDACVVKNIKHLRRIKGEVKIVWANK